MKKIILLAFILAAGVSLESCKKKATKKADKPAGLVIDTNRSEINWTAYKTTDKVPVKGKFTQLTLKNQVVGKTAVEALNGVTFSIPVSSIFSNNPDRDNKLKTLFFGAMKNTSLLSGKISITDEHTGVVALTMNGVTENLAFTYRLEGAKKVVIKSTMNTDQWKTATAMASLNKACFELHKGPDGVSKTWTEVGIDINVYLK